MKLPLNSSGHSSVRHPSSSSHHPSTDFVTVCPFVEVLKPISLLIKLSPPNSRVQKLFKTSSFYFLLLFLRPFSRSNCRRSLLLTSYFYFYVRFLTSMSMGEIFLRFGGWVRRFGCVFFGLRV